MPPLSLAGRPRCRASCCSPAGRAEIGRLPSCGCGCGAQQVLLSRATNARTALPPRRCTHLPKMQGKARQACAQSHAYRKAQAQGSGAAHLVPVIVQRGRVLHLHDAARVRCRRACLPRAAGARSLAVRRRARDGVADGALDRARAVRIHQPRSAASALQMRHAVRLQLGRTSDALTACFAECAGRASDVFGAACAKALRPSGACCSRCSVRSSLERVPCLFHQRGK